MKRLALILVGLLLASCASPADLDEIKIAAQEDKGEVQRLADEILGITSTPEARVVRLCMIEATIVEVMTYRVTKFDVDYAQTAYGHIAALQATIAGMDTATLFPDTDMVQATLQIDRILIEVGQDRAERLVAAIAGWTNIFGVADRARILAAQTKLIAAMVRDSRRLIAGIEAVPQAITPQAGLEACNTRIKRNADRVGAMLGIIPQPEEN